MGLGSGHGLRRQPVRVRHQEFDERLGRCEFTDGVRRRQAALSAEHHHARLQSLVQGSPAGAARRRGWRGVPCRQLLDRRRRDRVVGQCGRQECPIRTAIRRPPPRRRAPRCSRASRPTAAASPAMPDRTRGTTPRCTSTSRPTSRANGSSTSRAFRALQRLRQHHDRQVLDALRGLSRLRAPRQREHGIPRAVAHAGVLLLHGDELRERRAVRHQDVPGEHARRPGRSARARSRRRNRAT